jgi:hypothetical protein
LGKINNTPLPDSKYLWPLFESVVNSIQSIEDSQITDGLIEVYAEREESLQLEMSSESSREYKPELTSFTSFAITDNGHGFDSINYKSFLTSDSTLKWKKGCKGIGRFLWLKSFDKVKVLSNFMEDDAWHKREFEFSFDGVVPDDNLADSDDEKRKTTIQLVGFKPPYSNKCPKSLDTLAKKIVEHCLIYFLLNKCPRIVLRDNLGESIPLNEYYENNIKDSLHQDHIDLDGNNFIIYHIKVPEGVSTHELHLCANDREVRSIKLDKFFPNLQRKIADGSEKGFYYCGYLTGVYLDEKVNNSRTDFDFSDKYNVALENDMPERKLVDAATGFISTYLQEYIDEINNKKEKRVNDFVAHKKPQYRLLLKQRPNVINDIKPNLTDGDLELALHAQVLKWDMEAKQRGEEIKDKLASKGISPTDIMPKYEEYCKEITAISRISLSEYIIRRKVILDLLETAIERKEDGAYENEDKLHSIICPMRYISDEVDFEEMNLWIIDERLAYHNFLASEKQMKELPTIDSKSEDRMDIAIFNDAFLFAGNTEPPFNSITIIEFKKPNRAGLNSPDTDPIRQVCRYIDEILEGKRKKANGRPFGNVESTAFYCYIIADLTDSMRKAAKGSTFTPTPDGDGYFGFNSNYNAYFEVISYDKLLRDAKARNQILFDKLFKPSPREIITNKVMNKPEIAMPEENLTEE